MTSEVTIEDLDLSVRSFNCLKQAGINTLTELFSKIDEGISSCMHIRNMGRKCLAEVLQKAQERGYPADEAVERYITELRENPEIRDEYIQAWEEIRDTLRQIIPGIPTDIEPHEGIPLKTLKGMSDHIMCRLSQQGILAVEELLRQHSNEENLKMTNLRISVAWYGKLLVSSGLISSTSN